jgi:hypothetical protein
MYTETLNPAIVGEWLVAEAEWMESELGVDQELLDSRWADRQIHNHWPELTQAEIDTLMHDIGWF